MKKIKFIFLAIIFTFSFSIQSNSKSVPISFADLAEKLMPSVVNISTTQTVTKLQIHSHLLSSRISF